jgi:hypothetical protein
MKRTPRPPLGLWPWLAAAVAAAAAHRLPTHEKDDGLSQAERQRHRQNRRPRPIDRSQPREHKASPSFPVHMSVADSTNTDDADDDVHRHDNQENVCPQPAESAPLDAKKMHSANEQYEPDAIQSTTTTH